MNTSMFFLYDNVLNVNYAVQWIRQNCTENVDLRA